jgi:SnoaL-like polyketide cyclase
LSASFRLTGLLAPWTAATAGASIDRIFDEIINEGRLEAVDELFAEDFVDHGPMGDIEGRDEFKMLVAQWRSAVPDVDPGRPPAPARPVETRRPGRGPGPPMTSCSFVYEQPLVAPQDEHT